MYPLCPRPWAAPLAIIARGRTPLEDSRYLVVVVKSVMPSNCVACRRHRRSRPAALWARRVGVVSAPCLLNYLGSWPGLRSVCLAVGHAEPCRGCCRAVHPPVLYGTIPLAWCPSGPCAVLGGRVGYGVPTARKASTASTLRAGRWRSGKGQRHRGGLPQVLGTSTQPWPRAGPR